MELDESLRREPSGPVVRVLEQPMRRRINEIIREEPGIKISQLCKEAQAGWGTVNYHLHVLKRAGLIVSRATGRDCLLFSSDYPAEDLPVTEALRRGRAERLAEAIAQKPGASQKELCAQVHMTRKIIRRYVGLLTDAGLVSERREAQYQRYYPNPLLVKHLRAAADGKPAGPIEPGPAPPAEAPDPATR